MDKEQIIERYKDIKKNRQEYGVFHKCVFHVHTPASYDYCLYEKEKEDVDFYTKLSLDDIFNIALNENMLPVDLFKTHEELPLDDTFLDKKEYIAFLLIAHKLFINKIEIAIVSDHNSIKGFNKLKKAIEIYNHSKANGVYTHVFLGVEISCADKNHVVGIFDSANKNIEDTVSKWLSENIMSEKDGTFYTSYDVLCEIHKNLNGIGYIAHIDTSDTFKNEFLSQAYRKKLFSIRHVAIGLSDINEISNTDRRIKMFNHEKTAYIWDCDSHSIDTLNNKCFWIKGQKVNFHMIKNALRDHEIAIQYEEPKEPNQFILGLVINETMYNFLTTKPQNKDNDRVFAVQFSDSLNCLIGGRGTGKSTVLNILNFVLGQYLPEEIEKGKNILDFICKHQSVYVYYRYNGKDCVITFSVPNKEYLDDDILKSFTMPTPFNQTYRYKYPYIRESIAEFALKNMIEVYNLIETPTEITLERESDKRRLLKSIFTAGYSVNDLVNIASSDYLGKYIYSIIFQNKTLSQPPTRNVRSQSGLLSWSNEMETHLLNRAQEVNNIIQSYNNTQVGKLKITYSQNNFPNIELSFDDLFKNSNSRWYKGYSIRTENVIEYLKAINSHMGLVQLINLFLTKQYLKLNSKLSVIQFCEEMKTELVDSGIVELNEKNIGDFFHKLKSEIFSDNYLNFWINELKKWTVQTESFGLEFNINNREQSGTTKPIYKRIGELSLGQKVVAMLSFVLSYSEYSDDFTPLIIDQPEDNLDNQYIYKNLVNDLRKMKGKRQVIIATHSSTIVTNAKAEQVIVMDSDNEKGWISKTGYPTNPAIIKHIVNHLEGGNDSFKHKSFIYDTVLSN